MMMKAFAGVDTHRDTHHVVVINEIGVVLDSFSIAATQVGYAEALARTSGLEDLVWGMEGTGSYGRPFADTLVSEHRIVYEVPGMITKRHRRRLRQRGKSDPQDAQAIAEAVLREQQTLPRHVESDEQEAIRLLYDRRNRAVAEQTAKVNRIRALALRLELPLATDLTRGRSLAACETALHARATHGFAQFELVDEALALVAELRRLQATIADLERRLVPFVERLAPELLAMRGCAVISAAGLVGHAGAMENYATAHTFASHAGVAPVSCSSGQYQSVRVNTGGNRQLNRCLHNIANVQMRTAGHAGKIYYDRKRAEGKTHREAMRCLKRQLASVVFRTLKHAANHRHNTAEVPVAA